MLNKINHYQADVRENIKVHAVFSGTNNFEIILGLVGNGNGENGGKSVL